MYKFIFNCVKQINIYTSQKIISNYEKIRISKIVTQCKRYRDKLTEKYDYIGEKCIEKGWYYR